MQEVQQSKDKTLASNRTLAEQNLVLQPDLEQKKEQLTKSYRCLQESFESYQLRKSTLGTPAPPTRVELTESSFVCVGGSPPSSDWCFSRALSSESTRR